MFTASEYNASEGTGMISIGVELNKESPQNIVLQLFVIPITAEGNKDYYCCNYTQDSFSNIKHVNIAYKIMHLCQILCNFVITIHQMIVCRKWC